MAQTRARGRRRAGRADAGAAWISYSDMMAALLLVFVLVLCYSIYQYFVMLETKTAELDEKGALLAVQEQQLDEQQATLTTQQATLQVQQDQLLEQQTALLTKQTELDSALTAINDQQGLLDTQSMTLEEQKQTIANAQAALIAKENALALAQSDLEAAQTELATAQSTLADQQTRLDAATSLLQTQKDALENQQVKIDNLVGVRTKIIQELSDALAKAKLSASVDKNTGDIALKSNIFFDLGKNTIRAEGKAQLDQFIPIYLSVLLRPEYKDYLGEIVIEGHTDSEGTYIDNLRLSQERALSVATYCLTMPGLSTEQGEELRSILTAKGRSISDLEYGANGEEARTASRRVEFKFRLKDSEMIDEMRQLLSAGDGQ